LNSEHKVTDIVERYSVDQNKWTIGKKKKTYLMTNKPDVNS
jgi:hypothetical protein